MPQDDALSCHWCHNAIKLFEGTWFDSYGEEFCKYHPLAYNITTETRTSFVHAHETEQAVYYYVRNMYIAPQTRQIDSNVVSLSRKASRTSKAAANSVLPKTGSIRREVYELIQKSNGMTDYELELQMGGKHQTLSASRRSLVIDGFLVDSGNTRKNDVGNDCIIWEVVLKSTLFG
jgi:hypothetical protein